MTGIRWNSRGCEVSQDEPCASIVPSVRISLLLYAISLAPTDLSCFTQSSILQANLSSLSTYPSTKSRLRSARCSSLSMALSLSS